MPPSSCSTATASAVDVDWRPEVAAARRSRERRRRRVRRPERLAGFPRRPASELGGAGIHLLAERAERLREDWVSEQLVDAGQGPGRGARVARRLRLHQVPRRAGTPSPSSQGPLPITIVRPSIIESALAEPRPGWIRGFRMAEPIIISYARGLLREFPGVPEGVIDVIPVDLVVAAIIAVAADGPRPTKGPTCTTWPPGSGTPSLRPAGRAGPVLVPRAPALRRRRPAHRGARVVVPGARPCAAPAAAGRPGHGGWPSAVGSLPSAGARRSGWPPRRAAPLADRALGYVELYGAYAETEALFRVDRLLALWDRLDADDRAALLLRPWSDRLGPLRPRGPSPLGGRPRPGRTTPATVDAADRSERSPARPILSPDRHMAAFDLENTLIASNVVDSYAWLATRHLPPAERARFVGRPGA